ncbi:MAG TPA: hypothetical protein VFQ15_02645, partial [Jiangellaceae bacterium]|nr:hypothetical protein [Jiangellaceae bacterium]
GAIRGSSPTLTRATTSASGRERHEGAMNTTRRSDGDVTLFAPAARFVSFLKERSLSSVSAEPSPILLLVERAA